MRSSDKKTMLSYLKANSSKSARQVTGMARMICGLMRDEDIHAVNGALPDYIGFVFAKSRRQVDGERAKP